MYRTYNKNASIQLPFHNTLCEFKQLISNCGTVKIFCFYEGKIKKVWKKSLCYANGNIVDFTIIITNDQPVLKHTACNVFPLQPCG